MEDRDELEAYVAEQLDDPTDDVDDVLEAVVDLAARLEADGDLPAALALMDRLAFRYADDAYVVALSDHNAAGLLWELQRLDEAAARARTALRRAEEDGSEDLVAAAMARCGALLCETGRRDDGEALLRDAIARFAGSEDDDVLRSVEEARRWLAYSACERGHELHEQDDGPGAEAAYREAIELGSTAAWLHLAVLLQGARGREAEEEAALRRAIGDDDDAVAAHAAGELGLLLMFRDDLDGARAAFELVAEQGDRDVAWHATGRLAYLAAARGDRTELEARVRTMSVARDEDDVDVTGAARAIARVPALLVGGRLTGPAWQRFQRSRWEAGRRRRARRLFG